MLERLALRSPFFGAWRFVFFHTISWCRNCISKQNLRAIRLYPYRIIGVISIISLLSSMVFASVNSAREKARIGAGKQAYGTLNHVLGASAIGAWSFEDGSGSTLTDSSGERNNGTIFGALWKTESECGLGLGRCLSFNGNGDFIEVPNSASLSVARHLTMAAWVLRTGNCPSVTDTCMVVNKEYDYEFGVRSGNTLQWAIKPAGGTWFWHNTNIVIPQGFWTHVAVAYDGAVVRSYRDGRMEDTFTCAFGDLERSNAVLRISGRLTQSGGSTFFGFLDEVRVYSEVLTAYHIKEVYLAGASRRRISMQK